MVTFEFATAHRVIFGSGTASQLEALARPMGRRLLLVTHRSFASRDDAFAQSLGKSAAATLEVSGEPDFDLVRRGVAAGQDCDHVIAVGGGSVIDTAKAIGMLLGNGGDPLDYAEVIGDGRPVEKPSLPWIAVPTTAGAGAEVTRNAVLRSPEHGVKVSLRSPRMLPSVALIDPELTRSLPPAVTAATGLDALSQVLEPFVSRRANPLTDALCRDGLTRISRSLLRAFNNGEDLVAREDLALGALFGGMALANSGLGAVHGFAAPIGGCLNAPHGAVCAALLAPVMEANLAAAPSQTKDRYAEVARILTGNADARPEEGVIWVRSLTKTLSIPGLAAYGLAESGLPAICEKAAQASSMQGNPVSFSKPELETILRAAL